jgi:hypothetical protein
MTLIKVFLSLFLSLYLYILFILRLFRYNLNYSPQ